MKFIDLFAGVGGLRRGLELAGHTCVGFCEWDKFATASYTSMHCITEEQRKFLATLNLNKRQKEILKEEYRNGEWYSNDICNVTGENIPRADCWTFGAPCQDFSIAGQRKGLDGDRSSLVREVFRILGEIRLEDRPEWLIYENVKGMLSSNRGWDFLAIILEMEQLGYDIEWQLLNSKDFGVPQNRERVYTVGHLRTRGECKIFPIGTAGKEDSIRKIDIIAHHQSYRRNTQVFSPMGITEALSTCQGGGREHFVAFGIDYNTNGQESEIANCIKARYDVGVSNFRQGRTAVAVVVDKDNIDNDPGFNQKGEPSFTLTAQDRHGVGLGFINPEDDGTCRTLKAQMAKNSVANFIRTDSLGATAVGMSIPADNIVSETAASAGVNITGNEVTGLTDVSHSPTKGIYVKLNESDTVYALWYEKYQCYIAIRKLTPRECFRLQGWSDDFFEKAAFVNSDSQLYKQAGNGVTVSVALAVGEAINAAKQGIISAPAGTGKQKRLF